MQYNSSLSKKVRLVILCIVVLIYGTGIVNAVQLPSESYSFEEYEIIPADYDIVPIYDGTEIHEITGWLNLVYWKDLMFIHIGHFFDKTPYGEFVGKAIFPIASSLLGLCFFIIFSRRNSPEQDPASTTAKILQYLKEHPGSRQQQIVTGIQKSRGAVAYQLYRLMNENKVETIDVPNGTGYYLKQDSLSPPEILVRAALENPQTREILALLSRHPHLTRHQIAEALKKSPDTIYWHLVNIDRKILTVHKKRNGHQYSLSPEAGRIYTELTHHRIP